MQQLAVRLQHKLGNQRDKKLLSTFSFSKRKVLVTASGKLFAMASGKKAFGS
jgi:hypothetical protein